jgi:glycosyltransferase involved in cell wall biosynthesis
VKPTPNTSPLRILAVSALWQGANDYAFVRAFRRAGHSVRVVSEHEYFPPWQNRLLRLAKRALKERIVEEYNAALLREARMLRPDLFFVFKGPLVQAKTLRAFRDMGTICIQFYPDTGFRAHSPQLWDAISEYDWFFSTKPNHAKELRHSHGYDRVSFLPHGFDPETHRPVVTTTRDISDYSCDVSFIGNISTKKRATMAKLVKETRDLDIAIWGPSAWGAQGGALGQAYRGSPVFGLEYAKAIRLSKINLGLLFEGNSDGAAADVITSRSFHIPASGGFMLHERTEEAESFFEDGTECAFFRGSEELAEKIRYYLEHEDERRQIAEAGCRRCQTSGYSIDDRAAAVIEKYRELRAKAGAS